MADEPLNPEDEEYKFSDIEESDIFGTKTQETASRKQMLQRGVLIAVGLIIVVLAVYKMFGMFFGTQRTAAIKQQQAISKSIQLRTKKQETTRQTIQLQQQGLDKQIQALQQKSQESTQTVNKLMTKINDIETNLEMINSRLGDMNDSLRDVNQQLLTQQQQIKKLRTPRRRKIIRKKAVSLPVYFIKAIIPGRAWLTTAAGTTLTVGVGDSIPGYGTVNLIDAQTGRVITSKGKVIRFSPADR